jgi:septum formation protein
MQSVPGLWNSSHRLILASKSQARRHLLASAGISFEVEVAEIDERAIEDDFLGQGGAAKKLAGVLAQAKAIDASRRRPGALCIGADQILTLEDRIFHKPGTMHDAATQLAALSGRTHRLTSAFAIARDGRVAYAAEDHADMTIRSLSAAQIDLYLRVVGDVALTSVGAYQVEGLGVHLMQEIRGDHATILGLPMLELLAYLRREGALTL